ncbi:tryptophan--tRNA ligase [Nakamurella sp. YIM 132087]|uniref:Tryptophan--tRNA ligase n=1 Tax=Nakamurella alba TaxID=2665158 RepID=A0A7K1FH49_9ACTN|nr:tryptophan--tRNA ligase [Nakamurella alba]MTD13400.1 tryptophan--tRNA ligase [Nakamurella alba]
MSLTHSPAADHDGIDTAVRRSAEIDARIAVAPQEFRVLTGDRPTGPLHLGHLFGSLLNRVRLQQLGVPITIVVADYQVITDRDLPGPVGERVLGLVADYLAVGLDPDRTVIFPHSAVPALNQLLVPFLSLVSDAEIRRNPTVKAELAASGRALSGLLLTYPIHQAADILGSGGTLVPVGRDQLPHLEITRVIARRFTERYGPVFAEPDALLSEVPLLLGTDGEKMSKSRGNTVPLGATADETAAILRRSVTDARRDITFEPEERPGVSALLAIGACALGITPEVLAATIGTGGSKVLKDTVTDAVNDLLAPIRARRAELAADPAYLTGVLLAGTAEANATANDILGQVRRAMGMDYFT